MMQEELKKEIRRCQFLQIVYCDLGKDYEETNDLLSKDISAALIALDGDFNEQMEAYKKLGEWL